MPSTTAKSLSTSTAFVPPQDAIGQPHPGLKSSFKLSRSKGEYWVWQYAHVIDKFIDPEYRPSADPDRFSACNSTDKQKSHVWALCKCWCGHILKAKNHSGWTNRSLQGHLLEKHKIKANKNTKKRSIDCNIKLFLNHPSTQPR